MQSSNKKLLILFTCAVAIVLYSCSGMYDAHQDVAKKYAEVGETIYIGKLDSLKTFSGKERVKLRYWVSDSRASKLLIYWQSRTDSLVLDIPSDPPGDSVDVVIPDLPEATYLFEMLTMDEDSEDRSIAVDVSAQTYGQEYQASLQNRPLNFVGLDIGNNNQLTINWFKALGSAIGTEVQFEDTQGETQSVFVPVGDEQKSVQGFHSELKYRTVFLPEPTAIDTFYTDYVSISLEDYLPFQEKIDSAPFSRWNPGFPYSEHGSFPLERLWNGETFNDFFLFNYPATYTEYPFIFTFDLGQLVKLENLKYHQRIREQHDLMYTHPQNLETFSIWGAVDSTGLNQDYSSGWQKIGDFTIEKPSGLPYGEISDEDIQAAIDGHDFDIDPNAPEVRYIRFEVTGKWVGEPDPTTALGELQFWGTHAYFTNQ